MARNNTLDGVFAINKPVGMSSAQLIRDCQTYFNPSALFQPLMAQEAAQHARESNSQQRRRSRAKRAVRVKLGHGGTLDPLASGVLILGIGRGTKTLPRFLECTKTYETVVVFGASTDTYDRVGRVLQRRPYDHITRGSVEQALADHFRGRFRQMPPLYSALKMNGKPLYEYARQGLAIPREIETREVVVSACDILEWYPPGTHPHRWPAEEAGSAEQSLAERVWRVERDQAAGKKPAVPAPSTPEEEKSDREARAAHEDFKRRAEEKQDALVYDRPPSKRQRRAAEAAAAAAAAAATPFVPAPSASAESKAAEQRREGGARGSLAGDRTAVHSPAASLGKKQAGTGHDHSMMMSGALGELPRSPYHDYAKAAKEEQEEEAKREEEEQRRAEANGVNGAEKGGDRPSPSEAASEVAPTSAPASASSSAEPIKARPGRGSNLIPPPPDPDAPPPWEDAGPPAVRIRLTVSSGFYVRSFCHDLGEKVGSAALMAELARTRQSDFCVGTANCLEYDDLEKGEAVWGPQVERLLQLWHSGDVAAAGGVEADKETDLAAAAGVDAAVRAQAKVLPTPGDEEQDNQSEWNGIAEEAEAEKDI